MPIPLASSDPPPSPFQPSLLCLDPPYLTPFTSVLHLLAHHCLTTFDSIYLLVLSFLTAFDSILPCLNPLCLTPVDSILHPLDSFCLTNF